MRKIISAVIAVLIVLCIGGCSAENTAVTQNNKTSAISFTDDDGIEINMDKPAERIISLYSAHTENIYSLGAGDKLIGGYKTCVYPPEAAFLPKYDYNGDAEEVIAAEPDAVIIRPFVRKKAPDYVKLIENSGITVISLYPDKFDEFDDYINKLALITGTQENAEAMLEKFHSDISDIAKITDSIENKTKIFFESTETNIRTVTDDSMAGLAIKFAGGINIAQGSTAVDEQSSIAEFGEERVLENADNIDVYVSQRGSMNSGGNLISISERAGFDTIKAVKDGRVFTINEKLISSPTFRYVKGVNQMARFLYPEIMDNTDEYKNDEKATRKTFADIVVKFDNIPIYVPSSSSYYNTEQKGHTFGMFEDVKWTDDSFDNIETAVYSGYVPWDREGDKEYYYPERAVTRDELAQTVFVMGDFSDNGKNTPIADINESEHQRIVQILVDNGVFELTDGKFEPEKEVTNNEILSALSFLSSIK